jgi:hypothetical protein
MSFVKSVKTFLKKSSCGCSAKTRKNKNKRNSKRKNYRGGYKALNTINDDKISLSGSNRRNSTSNRRNSPTKKSKRSRRSSRSKSN